jgi:hypothetical protein
MGNPDFIPRKDVDFNQWVNNLFTYLSINYVRFSILAAVIEKIQLLLANWTEKYLIADTPATRTKPTIREKDEARKELEQAVRTLIREYLIFNHLVSDSDRDNLGIPVHKTTRTSVPAPASMVEAWISTDIIRQLGAHFRVLGSTSNAKDENAIAVEIRYIISETPPLSVTDMPKTVTCSHTPYIFTFDENQRGKTVYFCFCWINAKGEKGPDSEFIMAKIP